jgi:O-antigen/teichoic acid export membrane protein
MGGQAGILQGERRWWSLAAIYLTVGIGRIGFGVAALVVRPDTLGAMTGVTVGAFLPAVVGWLALRRPDRREAARRAPRHGSAGRGHRWAPEGVLRETMHNSHALLAFFALSNADVVIARNALNEHQAGLYAGGLILAKAVLFLPQFVVVIAFPFMAKRDAGKQMHLISLGAVLVIGAVTVAGVAALSGLALIFIGGPEYAELQSRLWVFAVIGTLLALLQLMIYNIVARQKQRAVLLVWGALAALAAAASLVGSVTGLLTVVVGVDTVLFLVLLVRSLTPSYGAAGHPDHDDTQGPGQRPRDVDSAGVAPTTER